MEIKDIDDILNSDINDEMALIVQEIKALDTQLYELDKIRDHKLRRLRLLTVLKEVRSNHKLMNMAQSDISKVFDLDWKPEIEKPFVRGVY